MPRFGIFPDLFNLHLYLVVFFKGVVLACIYNYIIILICRQWLKLFVLGLNFVNHAVWFFFFFITVYEHDRENKNQTTTSSLKNLKPKTN